VGQPCGEWRGAATVGIRSATTPANRDIPRLIEGAGFAIEKLETMYLPGTPRFAGFNYWGAARKL